MNTEPVTIKTEAPPVLQSKMLTKQTILEDLLQRVISGKKSASTEKKAVVKKKYEPYSWLKSYYSGSGDKLQYSNQSRPERFPLIFNRVKELHPNAKRVLSFGCSVGHEVEALAKRFPEAELVGVDIDYSAISTARQSVKLPNVYFHDEIGGLGKFDVITALQVMFCLETPIPKKRWLKAMEKLDRHIAPGGVIAIYTSEYPIEEVLTPDKYETIHAWVREHNKKAGSQYFNGYYRRKTDEQNTSG